MVAMTSDTAMRYARARFGVNIDFEKVRGKVWWVAGSVMAKIWDSKMD
jgi:hypothetical protein